MQTISNSLLLDSNKIINLPILPLNVASSSPVALEMPMNTILKIIFELKISLCRTLPIKKHPGNLSINTRTETSRERCPTAHDSSSEFVLKPSISDSKPGGSK